MSGLAHSFAHPGLFGDPPSRLVDHPPQAQQFSPLVPGAAALDDTAPGSLDGMTMLAAPGTLERRHDIAAMLRALRPGASFTALAPKDLGGARLGREFADFGCPVEDSAKAHHRICRGTRPAALDDAAISSALAAGGPRQLDGLGLWSQPGVFSWDRIDPGSLLLRESLPHLAGRGADFGCGIGILAHTILGAAEVSGLVMIDIDRRAVAAARRNVDDPRATFLWADIRAGLPQGDFDFVVMNPPFHDSGTEDKGLGQAFLRRAAETLRKGGQLWLVANRHLPYESVLGSLFRRVAARREANGFKVIEAVK